MKIRSIPDLQNAPAIRGRLIVDTYRGQLRVRSWPRPQSAAHKKKTAYQREWFRIARELAKYAEPLNVDEAIKIAKGTGLYPSDILMMAMANNLYGPIMLPGRIIKKWEPKVTAITFQGARVVRTTNLSLPANSFTVIDWQHPNLQSAEIWAPTVPDRLVVPDGVNVVSLHVGGAFTTNVAGQAFVSIIDKNGDRLVGQDAQSTGGDYASASTGPIGVVPGDYFKAEFLTESARQLTAGKDTFFSMIILGADPE